MEKNAIVLLESTNLFSYYENLNKTQQKRFDKVLGYYKELKPRYYNKVSQMIADSKSSNVVKEECQYYNVLIKDCFFVELGFVRKIGNFAVGDTFYVHKREHTIVEFDIRPNGVFVIPENFGSALSDVYMIEQISHKEREEKGFSHFYELSKTEKLFDKCQTTQITSDVEMFLSYYSKNEYDFEPEYQRDLVWTVDQKEAFVKALMIGDVELTPTFITKPYHEVEKGAAHREVLDGKQRLNAVISYVKGEFSVDGLYFKDLGMEDLSRFYRTRMVYTDIKYYDDKKGWSLMTTAQKVELFLQINDYGQHVSEDHLEQIKEKYLKK